MTPLLSLQNISMTFDGFQALTDVSFAVEQGTISAVIGPNGAGKTTLFNIISGAHPPTVGEVSFAGRSITRAAVTDRVRMGMLRSFQRTSVFPELTVLQNVVSALMVREGRAWSALARLGSEHDAAAEALLRPVGLLPKRDVEARALSHGDQKVLDLVLALALEPKLLLLDEPTAGMSSEDTRRTIDLIEALVRDRAVTLLFTEHDMEVVFRIASRIVVLHHGEVIAHGLPADVRKDPQVRRVYLGERQ